MKRTCSVFLALTCFLKLSAFAQPDIKPDDLWGSDKRVLQPGDQLEINILNLPEQEKKYPIRADGTFFHPFAGEVKAAGKTLAELETLLRQRFKKELKRPEFRIGVSTMAEGEAAIMGEVKSQGKFKFTSGTTVVDLLAQAGGVTERADLDGSFILRSGKQISLNLGPSGQAELARMKVQKGDIIYVNKGRKVGVSGEVQAKGIYAINSKSLNPVEDAIKSAGGATESGALNRVQIIRPSLAKPLEVNLLEPSEACKVALEEGDTVVLPARKAVVLGAVSKAGALPLVGKETLLDVIGQAGIAKGKLDSIVVIRSVDVIAGKDTKEIYNLENSFSEGNPVVNVPINDGDLVYVPAQEEQSLFTNPTGFMSLLVMARSLFAF